MARIDPDCELPVRLSEDEKSDLDACRRYLGEVIAWCEARVNPSAELLADLTPLQQRIVRFLCVRRSASLDDLLEAWNGDAIQPASQLRRIQDLQNRLLEFNRPIVLDISGSVVTLRLLS